jgi:hypothetical protein
MVANVGESLAISNQTTQKFYAEKFSIRKLSEMQVRKQYQSRNSKRFAALENLNNSEDINRVWENIEENVQTSAKKSLILFEWKQHKLCFEASSQFLDQRKQAKMQWLRDVQQSNFDYLNSVRCKTNRYVRKKNTEYLKANIDELKSNNNIKNIRDLYRGIND